MDTRTDLLVKTLSDSLVALAAIKLDLAEIRTIADTDIKWVERLAEERKDEGLSLYDGIVGSEADIETLKWRLGEQIKKGTVRVIVSREKEVRDEDNH